MNPRIPDFTKRSMGRRAFCISAWSLSCFLVGCAGWSREKVSDTTPQLAPPKKTPDSVIVEATLIRFPEEASPELNAIWQVVDESIIELDTRRGLQANGVRCGVLVGEMPQIIRARMKELNAEGPDNFLERLGIAAEVSSDTLRLHCHAGRRKELPMRVAMSDSVTVLHTAQGHVKGATYSQPTMLMDLRAVPHSDGRSTIKLTPEIQHGEAQKRIVSNQNSFHPEMRRDHQRWDNLCMEATLSPGQFFFCTVTDPPFGLGQAMFTTRTSELTTERVLLVIRLVSSELDGLFAPEEVEAARLAAERT